MSPGASGYGEMWVHAQRFCSMNVLGQAAAAATEMAAAVANERDNPDALQLALLCAGAEDAAAALYIRRLGDVTLRAGALEELSTFQPNPARLSSFLADIERRRDTLRARADVKAAVAAVGHTEAIPLRSEDF